MRDKSRVVRGALVGAAVGGMWTLLLARQAPQQNPAISWDRARQAVGQYRTMLDTSGLVEVDAQLPPNVRHDDLQAMCAARQEAVRKAKYNGTTSLRTLIPGDDPITAERRAAFERYLGAVAGFEGDADAAAAHFQSGRDALARMIADAPDLEPSLLNMELALGMAHMRQGENSNCLVMMANPDRCLFPIRPGGQHMNPQGAELAIESFTRYLEREPDDLGVRWLLNVAYMLIGRYPGGVPREYLIEPKRFEPQADMPRFVDVAAPTGLGRRTDIAGGTITEDFDGDSLVDVFFTSVDYCAPSRLYRNRGDGTFEDRSEAAGVASQLGGINAVSTDFNNDGRPDVFIMRGGWETAMRNSLLRNDGTGVFTDVTREAGLLDASFATHSVAWADFDRDGWLDVYVAHELAPSQLFRNRHDGTFEDVTARAGVGSTAFTKGVVAGDYDGDSAPDLYLSNMFGDNILYRNRGDGTFEDVSAAAGVQKPLASFPTWFFDYDNDGRLDIFVASYPNSVEELVKFYVGKPLSTEPVALYHNKGDGTFEHVSRSTGLERVIPAMGSNFGDLDNDGFLDMYLGTGTPSFGALMPNIMLLNDRGRRFLDVTAATGTGNIQKGHGVAFVDIDNDGDEDVVLNSGGAVPGDNYTDSLFENPGTKTGNWIAVKLVGVKTNRPGIGAKIRVTLPDASSGSALRYREVTTGGSFGAGSFVQHIGIGEARAIRSLEIAWPVSRTRQTLDDVPINALIEVTEGKPGLKVLHPPRVTLAPDAGTGR